MELDMLMLMLAKNVMEHFIRFLSSDLSPSHVYPEERFVQPSANSFSKKWWLQFTKVVEWPLVVGSLGGNCLLLTLVLTRAWRNSWKRKKRNSLKLWEQLQPSVMCRLLGLCFSKQTLCLPRPRLMTHHLAFCNAFRLCLISKFFLFLFHFNKKVRLLPSFAVCLPAGCWRCLNVHLFTRRHKINVWNESRL